MNTLNELKAIARAKDAEVEHTNYALALDSDAVVVDAVAGLIEYFGEDDNRQAVQLILLGEEVGYITRTDLYNLVAMEEKLKGIGASDHSRIPGRGSYRLISIRCPMQGCEQVLLVTSFNEDNPPRCSVHTGIEMEVLR